MFVNSFSPQISRNTETSQKDTHASFFYFNDLHGRLIGAERLKTASDIFDGSAKQNTDQLKLSAGDACVGRVMPRNNFFTHFLNMVNIDAGTIGNHEFDLDSASLSKLFDKIRFKYVSTNLNLTNDSPLKDDVEQGRLVRSTIIEKNGNKYGILGALPPDMKKRIAKEAQDGTKDVTIDDIPVTIKELQEEADKFKQQGINKVIFVSHLGHPKDIEAAQKTSGIDIIIGGHTHNIFKDIQPGVNLCNSASGEPVLITEAGKDGENYGVLDVVFDSLGRLKQATNTVKSTNELPKSLMVKYFEERHLGKPQPIGILEKSIATPSEQELVENPIPTFMADALRIISGSQIAFTNPGTVKGGLNAGTITDRDIQELNPYRNSINMYKFTEKDIIDALKGGIESQRNTPHRPGILQVSGLRYTVGKNAELKDVYLENQNGSLTKLNIEHPDTTKTYTVTYNTYLSGGPEHLEMLKCPEKIVKSFDWSDLDATIDYIKSFNNKPIEIKTGRITIER